MYLLPVCMIAYIAVDSFTLFTLQYVFVHSSSIWAILVSFWIPFTSLGVFVSLECFVEVGVAKHESLSSVELPVACQVIVYNLCLSSKTFRSCLIDCISNIPEILSFHNSLY